MFSATIIAGTGESSWWIIAIPRRSAVALSGICDFLAVELDAPRIRTVDPGEHLHQRRLARAVLAHQGVHRAGLGVQVDIVERLDTGERLRDPRHPEENFLTHPLPHAARLQTAPAGAPERGQQGPETMFGGPANRASERYHSG